MRPALVAKLHSTYQAEIDSTDVEWLAGDLGVSCESLRRLEVGWCREFDAHSFPMRAGSGEVIGLRLRNLEGGKFAVTGSRSGLFLPTFLSPSLSTLYVVEGESDCASLLTYGFNAIGRPSCRGCLHRLMTFIHRCRPVRVVFIADADRPGVEGATEAASRVKRYVPTDVYQPVDFKDIREMLRAGVTRHKLNRSFIRV